MSKDTFNTGLDIFPKSHPMGFEYGDDCFGPKVELRKLNDIRKSLKDPNCIGPETVYAIAMHVGKKRHFDVLEKKHLLFGVVTYAEGQLGEEPIRSQGHIHKKSSYAKGWSTPEVYQIWSGKAVIYMQEYADDDPGRCFAVYAEPGDIVIVPPSWAHATISADSKSPLTFGAWCDYDYGFEYEKVRAHKGLAWFPIVMHNGSLEWSRNDHYLKRELVCKRPQGYSQFNIEQGKSIYTQFEENSNLFDFVPKPHLLAKLWDGFVP